MITARTRYTLFILASTISYGSYVCSMGLTSLHDIPLKPAYHCASRFQCAALGEAGISTRAFDSEKLCNNVLRIWNDNQNALGMANGNPNDPLLMELARLVENYNDDMQRGRFTPSGKLDLRYSLSFAAQFIFNHGLSLAFYLPVYGMQLSNVSWCYNTLSGPTEPSQNSGGMVTEQEINNAVQDIFTNDFAGMVQKYGRGLSIDGWKRTGLGDAVLLLEWIEDFKQAKPFLKNVRLNARLGLSLPTGLKQDEDKIFALPFGHDGAVGLIWGGNIELSLGDYMYAGVDVELLHLFGNTRLRRIKTDQNQTDLLFLQKACAYKDWGLTQQFNLYIGFAQFYKGLSCRFNYQYLKHGDDRLAIDFPYHSNRIANSAVSLQEWTAHTFVGKIGYDFGCHLSDSSARPSLWLYGKLPFNGQRSALFSSVGLIFSCEF